MKAVANFHIFLQFCIFNQPEPKDIQQQAKRSSTIDTRGWKFSKK